MPAYYTLRMQFGPHHDSQAVARELEQLCRRVPVDEVLFFLCGEELSDGHPAIERIAEWLAALVPWKKRLEDMGVRVSLNPWTVVGVCDRGRRLKPEQNWRTMMDPLGRACEVVTCPLDVSWRQYFRQALGLMAAGKFRVIWIEDDFRYHNHEPLEWGGCFCDLHVAEFNRRAGALATREEIVQTILKAGPPHPWRKIWLDLWQETALDLVDEWRRIVEPHGTRLGLMSSGIDEHAREGRRWSDWWKALAGPDKPPIHRPHFWTYGDFAGKGMMAEFIAGLDQNRRLEPPGAEVGPEIENFNYYGWNKSYAQTAAQMYLAQVFGSTNLNVSLYDFMGNLPSDDPSRAEFLRGLKPALSRVAELFPPTLQSAGVGVVWREDASRKLRTTGSEKPQSVSANSLFPDMGAQGAGELDWNRLLCPSRAWVQALAATGFGFAMADQPRVNALGGAMAWAPEDGEIELLLSQGLILDGPAAAILEKRGFGRYVGLTDIREIRQEEITFSVELLTSADFSPRAGSQASLNLVGPICMGRLAGAEAISRVLDASLRDLAPGVTIFENALGGRVAVVPYDIRRQWMWSLHRVVQLRRVLGWLSRGNFTGSVEGGIWLIPQFLTDGHTFRVAVWNAGSDPVESFMLLAPAGWPKMAKAILLDAGGKMEEFAVNSGNVSLPRPLRQWELAVVTK